MIHKGKVLVLGSALVAIAAIILLLNSVRSSRLGATGGWTKVAEEGEYQFFAPSPDGRWIAAVEQQSGNLVLCDFANRRFQPLTHKAPNVRDGAWSACFSRDGKSVAYEWSSPNGPQVWLAGLDDRSDHLLLQEPKITRASPIDWSPDGTRILLKTVESDGGIRFALASVPGGTLVPIDLGSYRRIGQLLFSPDGAELWFDALDPARRSSRGIFALSLDGFRCRTLLQEKYNAQIAAIAADRKRLTILSDRGGDYGLWNVSILADQVLGIPELAEADIGPILPLGSTSDGTLYYKIFADSVSVQLATLDLPARKLSSPLKRLQGNYIGHISPAFSADGTRLSFVAWKTSFESLIGIRSIDGTVRELELDLNQFSRPIWRDGQRLVVFGSGKGKTGFFELNADTGTLELLMDATTAEATGEGAWSRDGSVWFNRYASPRRGLFRHDFRKGSRSMLFSPAEPEAVQQNISLSPDGANLAFSVRGGGASKVMVIPAEGGPARVLWAFEESAGNRPALLDWLADSLGMLVARTTGDNSGELWLVPINGQPASRIEFPDVAIRSLRLSADGKTLACVTGANRIELRKRKIAPL
jgi:dipeptidyl aminopeptidase/acylaminoacyl peptidase